MGNFTFEQPLYLLFLLAMPIIWLIRNRVRSYRPVTMKYSSIHTVKGGRPSWKLQLQKWLPVMRWLGVALLIIALARPQTGESEEVVTGDGIDIILALDISGSMQSLDFMSDEDVQLLNQQGSLADVTIVNRLVEAKNVIREFVADRRFDRVGLVVFAQEAFVQSPMTIDHTVFNRLLRQIELAPDLGLDDGTAIGLGVATSTNMLRNSDADSKIVILLTDGVNNSGQIAPITAAQAAEALGIKVYTIGMGKTGNVPVLSSNVLGNLTVGLQQSSLDEETLKEIAEITGGQFFRAEEPTALRNIYREINKLEKSTVEINVFQQFDEWMVWALLPAVVLLTGEILLRHTLLRRLP